MMHNNSLPSLRMLMRALITVAAGAAMGVMTLSGADVRAADAGGGVYLTLDDLAPPPYNDGPGVAPEENAVPDGSDAAAVTAYAGEVPADSENDEVGADDPGYVILDLSDGRLVYVYPDGSIEFAPESPNHDNAPIMPQDGGYYGEGLVVTPPAGGMYDTPMYDTYYYDGMYDGYYDGYGYIPYYESYPYSQSYTPRWDWSGYWDRGRDYQYRRQRDRDRGRRPPPPPPPSTSRPGRPGAGSGGRPRPPGGRPGSGIDRPKPPGGGQRPGGGRRGGGSRSDDNGRRRQR